MQFGQYRLVGQLGCGGMAEVFLAVYEPLYGFSKQLALKRILPQYNRDPAFVRMFVEEAALSAKMTHPNVAATFDFGAVDGVYFLAMEYVDGVDLRSLLHTNEALSALDVATLGAGLAAGLAHVHDLGVVHRDVSPHNVMVSRTGVAKLMDFGVAKGAVGHTAPSVLRGKIAYMAPEHAAGVTVDARADQFSLGLVLWESCTLRRAYAAEHESEVLRLAILGEVPRLPGDLGDVIAKCLMRDPQARYATMHEVAEHLQRIAATRIAAGETTSWPARVERTRVPCKRTDDERDHTLTLLPARHRRRMGMLVALLIATLGLFVTTRESRPVPAPILSSVIAPSPPPAPIVSTPFVKKRVAAPPSVVASGEVSLRALGPWLRVYHEGTLLGTTPLGPVKLPAGEITLRLVNETAGIDELTTVTVPAAGRAQRTLMPGNVLKNDTIAP